MDTLGLAVRDTLPIGHELWQTLRADAARVAAQEETLTAFLDQAVLSHHEFAAALSALLVRKLACKIMTVERLSKPVEAAMVDDPGIVGSAAADLAAILARDPAADSCLTPFLYFKGFHALQWHRIANWLWGRGRHDLAHFLQSRVSEAFAVDIHPAVPVGRGVFIDHGTGVVIGETAVIGNDVSILQNVTLGGTGKEHGDRHPKVKDGVLLAAGAKVLGNITLGARSKVGAGSVVLRDVPPCATVAGIPAKIVGWCREEAAPALTMDMSLQQGDYSI